MIAIPPPTAPLPAVGAPENPAAGTGSFRERLQDLPPDVAAELSRVGSRRQWRRGQVVVRQGAHRHAIVVALQGRLSITLGSPDGRSTLMRWLDDGEIVGLADVLAGMPSPVTVMAQGPASTLLVERDAFVQVLRQHPEGAIGIAVLLSRRVGELFRYIEMTGARPLADRVAFALQRLARSQGRPDSEGHLRLKVTQADLAMAANASRQRVHLALQRLQADGRIRLGYGTVTLLTTDL
jgi:CRP-like cAMP-binding protein